MITITKVETIQSKGIIPGLSRVGTLNTPNINFTEQQSPIPRPTIRDEVIRGEIYINNRGEEVCIGVSKEVQDILGFPLRKFDSMRSEIKRLENHYAKLRTNYDKAENALLKTQWELNMLKSLTFWKRIRFVLRGK